MLFRTVSSKRVVINIHKLITLNVLDEAILQKRIPTIDIGHIQAIQSYHLDHNSTRKLKFILKNKMYKLSFQLKSFEAENAKFS